MENNSTAFILAEFTTFVIDKYDTNEQSSRNQILVKGVFAGASCGSLVEYAKEQRRIAYLSLSTEEILEIETRSRSGKD